MYSLRQTDSYISVCLCVNVCVNASIPSCKRAATAAYSLCLLLMTSSKEKVIYLLATWVRFVLRRVNGRLWAVVCVKKCVFVCVFSDDLCCYVRRGEIWSSVNTVHSTEWSINIQEGLTKWVCVCVYLWERAMDHWQWITSCRPCGISFQDTDSTKNNNYHNFRINLRLFQMNISLKGYFTYEKSVMN